jgi:hypothetical protein
MLVSDLNRQLMSIRRNYYHGLISKAQAKISGKAVIRNEFETLLRLSRDRIKWTLKRPVELPPEDLVRLEQWRDGYIADWGRIIDDIKRAGD